MLQVRLSRLNIYTRPFRERGDEREHVIIFSCRKCMGVKLNVHLFQMIKAERWELLPDELFTLLLYYEIIVHDEPGEIKTFYDFRALVLKHLKVAPLRIDHSHVLSAEPAWSVPGNDSPELAIEGLDVARKFYERYGIGPADHAVVVRIAVSLTEESALPLLLGLLKQAAASEAVVVKNITVRLKAVSLIDDKTLLNSFRAFSRKVPLNFTMMEEDYAASDTLYTLLLNNEIWGDYFFDLSEYTTFAEEGAGVKRIAPEEVPASYSDAGMLHVPLAVAMKEIQQSLLVVLNACLEKMIFIKYKIWPV
ncbi:hypothetical protein [Chitinophaga sp. XS-30]|uniref:hypothetical protein n=1 Tax=Chitinophaga sp. XS-30 TaxID=2604421 RepID=UPI0011DCA1F3|nr:hypothetical protein [Chitinophaga sp. XS-30]QEH42009.1 hypothetical protein FW415_14455 [Chitinophaga sp. XS-30]